MSYCYHWASVVRLSLAFCILINSSKTIGSIWTKLWWNGPWVVPFQNCIHQSPCQPRWLSLLKIENSAKNHLKIISFLAHLTQRVHVSYCHHWASVVCRQSSVVCRPSSVVRRPSFNFSHFNQLLWSHWVNLNQTLVEWSLDGPLPKLCPVIPTSNQNGRQAKNRKKGGMKF